MQLMMVIGENEDNSVNDYITGAVVKQKQKAKVTRLTLWCGPTTNTDLTLKTGWAVISEDISLITLYLITYSQLVIDCFEIIAYVMLFKSLVFHAKNSIIHIWCFIQGKYRVQSKNLATWNINKHKYSKDIVMIRFTSHFTFFIFIY